MAFHSGVESLRRQGDTGQIRTLVITSAAATVLGLLILVTGGKPVVSGGLLAVVCVVFLTIYRLDWGFYLFIGMVLIFDQFEVPDVGSLTYIINYFNNINTITYLPEISAGVVSPMELQLLLLLLVWFSLLAIHKNIRMVGHSIWPLAVMFFGWLLISLFNGVRDGGDTVVAMWELRALFYMGLMYFFVPQIIKTREQVHNLMWVCIAGISFKAFEGTVRFVGFGLSMGGNDALLNHEDPVFFITLLIMLAGFVVFKVKTEQKRALWILTLPILLGFYAGNRRAAYASAAVSLLTFIALLPWSVLKRFLKFLTPVGVLLTMYGFVFWGSSGRIAGPINQIRSGFVTDEDEIGERNFYSNLYRKIEDFNLAATIQKSPLTGIGFGTKYEQPLTLVAINYSLRDYMAHNNVVWLLVKIGGIGFFLFWLFLDGFALRATGILRNLTDPYLQVVCIVIIVAVINQIVAAYFDLHLVRYRTLIYLGTLMGTLPALESSSQQPT